MALVARVFVADSVEDGVWPKGGLGERAGPAGLGAVNVQGAAAGETETMKFTGSGASPNRKGLLGANEQPLEETKSK